MCALNDIVCIVPSVYSVWIVLALSLSLFLLLCERISQMKPHVHADDSIPFAVWFCIYGKYTYINIDNDIPYRYFECKRKRRSKVNIKIDKISDTPMPVHFWLDVEAACNQSIRFEHFHSMRITNWYFNNFFCFIHVLFYRNEICDANFLFMKYGCPFHHSWGAPTLWSMISYLLSISVCAIQCNEKKNKMRSGPHIECWDGHKCLYYT